jgi:hypothetical protein
MDMLAPAIWEEVKPNSRGLPVGVCMVAWYRCNLVDIPDLVGFARLYRNKQTEATHWAVGVQKKVKGECVSQSYPGDISDLSEMQAKAEKLLRGRPI